MAGLLNIEVDDAQARRKLEDLQAVAGDMRPAFAAVGRAMATRIRLCFKMGIDPWGSPWAKLKFRRGQPLRDSGRLQRSITSAPDATGVTVGTNVMYAPTHQFGAVIKPKPGFWSSPSKAGPGRRQKMLVFPGPGGRMIFAKKVTIPARPFLPLRRYGGAVDLPPAWAKSASRALRDVFAAAGLKD